MAVVLPVALRPDAAALAAVMPRVAAAATAAAAGQDAPPADIRETAGSAAELRREVGRLSAAAAADSTLMSSTIFS